MKQEQKGARCARITSTERGAGSSAGNGDGAFFPGRVRGVAPFRDGAIYYKVPGGTVRDLKLTLYPLRGDIIMLSFSVPPG